MVILKEMNFEDFGRRVRKRRTELGWTQGELAERIGTSLSFVGHIERGTRKASLDTLVRICNALQVSPQLLLQDSLADNLLGEATSVSDNHRRLLREISNVMLEYGVEMPEDRYR